MKTEQLVQTTIVKYYQHQFEALANKGDDIKPNTMKEMFIVGLKVDIQKDVVKVRLDSLLEAFFLAQLYENDDFSADLEKYSPLQPLIVSAQGRGNQLQQQHYTLPHKRTLSQPAPTPKQPVMRQKLSPIKMRIKRTKNECFNCIEK